MLPEKFPPHTELLDLQPLPIQALRIQEFVKLYSSEFSFFNPLQTQAFTTLYTGDESVLIAAPTSSGKTVCAELAILRLFSKDMESSKEKRGAIVYVAPLQTIAQEKMKVWAKKFGSLGKAVAMLTGDSVTDVKLLDKADIIISTAERWDILSRRWKQRKGVQLVRLFIVDELHMIGGDEGPILEAVVSRMRYIASQIENKIRIVALSSSLANAKDLGEWIGATPHSLFNFPPDIRPLPLEIRVQGFDNPHYSSRLLSMSKPTLHSVKYHAAGRPAIIFVPSKKQANIIASDLIVFSDDDDTEKCFLKVPVEEITPLIELVQSKLVREALAVGIGVLHEGLSEKEKEVVLSLFSSGAIQILVSTQALAWGMTVYAHTVVIMGTQYYNGQEHTYVDYPISTILQMIGRGARPGVDSRGVCVLLCHAPKKEYYKKFLLDPLPVESHLDRFLADHMNAEVVTKTIENKQDAVDYLTWTFFYRRLTQNPNYYNMAGVTHRHLSDHLSELIETTLSDLELGKCIAIEDEMDIIPMNMGIVAAYYYLKYTTIELFSSSLMEKTKTKGLVEILSNASEYDTLAIRHREERLLKKMSYHLPFSISNANYKDPHTKTNVLLQTHFVRRSTTTDLSVDQAYILEHAPRLLQAMVDVISSNGWLSPALACMELSQMVVQAVLDSDSYLKQLPHFSDDLVKKCTEKEIESVFDLMDLPDEKRSQLLSDLTPRQIADVASFCNRFPNIEVQFELPDKKVNAGQPVQMQVILERELEEGTELIPVPAPYFPKAKPEAWWLVVGDSKSNQLLAIKRVSLQRRSRVKLEFSAPETPGKAELTLFFMSDSFVGVDQEIPLDLFVNSRTDSEPMETS